MLEELCNQLIQEEGAIAWPYLDTRGNVTAGVGHRIPNLAAMLQLAWHVGDQMATPDQITKVWQWLLQQPPGKLASFYRQPAMRTGVSRKDLVLPDAAIRVLLQEDLDSTRKRVRGVYKGFDTYPGSVQKALLDMGFNLGVAGLILKFPHLHFLAEAGQWAQCAAECQRQGVSEARNQDTAQLFLQAV